MPSTLGEPNSYWPETEQSIEAHPPYSASAATSHQELPEPGILCPAEILGCASVLRSPISVNNWILVLSGLYKELVLAVRGRLYRLFHRNLLRV